VQHDDDAWSSCQPDCAHATGHHEIEGTQVRIGSVQRRGKAEMCPQDPALVQTRPCKPRVQCGVGCDYGEVMKGQCTVKCGGGVRPLVRLSAKDCPPSVEYEKCNEDACEADDATLPAGTTARPCAIDPSNTVRSKCSDPCGGVVIVSTPLMHVGYGPSDTPCNALGDGLFRTEECGSRDSEECLAATAKASDSPPLASVAPIPAAPHVPLGVKPRGEIESEGESPLWIVILVLLLLLLSCCIVGIFVFLEMRRRRKKRMQRKLVRGDFIKGDRSMSELPPRDSFVSLSAPSKVSSTPVAFDTAVDGSAGTNEEESEDGSEIAKPVKRSGKESKSKDRDARNAAIGPGGATFGEVPGSETDGSESHSSELVKRGGGTSSFFGQAAKEKQEKMRQRLRTNSNAAALAAAPPMHDEESPIAPSKSDAPTRGMLGVGGLGANLRAVSPAGSRAGSPPRSRAASPLRERGPQVQPLTASAAGGLRATPKLAQFTPRGTAVASPARTVAAITRLTSRAEGGAPTARAASPPRAEDESGSDVEYEDDFDDDDDEIDL